MRILRFLAVGTLNTAFGYATYALFVVSGLHYALAAGFATVLGILFNFRTYGRLVFGEASSRRLPRFVAVYAVLYLVNVAGIGALVRLGATELLAGVALAVPVAALGYLLNSRFVFGTEFA